MSKAGVVGVELEVAKEEVVDNETLDDKTSNKEAAEKEEIAKDGFVKEERGVDDGVDGPTATVNAGGDVDSKYVNEVAKEDDKVGEEVEKEERAEEVGDEPHQLTAATKDVGGEVANEEKSSVDYDGDEVMIPDQVESNDQDEEKVSNQPQPCIAQQLIEKSKSPLRTLFALCRGLKKEDGFPLYTDNEFRYISNECIKPKLIDLYYEMDRRLKLQGDTRPLSTQKRPEYYDAWLGKNPITNPVDLAFLRTLLSDLMEKVKELNEAPSDSSFDYLESLLEGTGLVVDKTALSNNGEEKETRKRQLPCTEEPKNQTKPSTPAAKSPKKRKTNQDWDEHRLNQESNYNKCMENFLSLQQMLMESRYRVFDLEHALGELDGKKETENGEKSPLLEKRIELQLGMINHVKMEISELEQRAQDMKNDISKKHF